MSIQPTDEQQRTFWEACGFIPRTDGKGLHWWTYPDGDAFLSLPPLTVENLLKYSRPRLMRVIEASVEEDPVETPYVHFLVLQRWITDIAYHDLDPATSLFWRLHDKIISRRTAVGGDSDG